ncbi:MAG TPA: T9SS type A sorting domain-containing protein, partial [Bacteroidia bacterium]|nr:T9SS type A sorting domain-containing protein [Bacteroidia bacterium]
SLMNDTLCGWYKFTPAGTDSATVFVQTTQNTSVVGANAIGLPAAANYTFFSLPFSSVVQPDTLLLVLASSYANTNISNVGSVFKIDDLYLKSSLAGIHELNWNVFGMVQLYPNPSSADCWIEFDNTKNTPVVLTISDALGKIISEITISETGHQRQHIDTSAMSKGSYLITLTQDGKRTSRPLLVQ